MANFSWLELVHPNSQSKTNISNNDHPICSAIMHIISWAKIPMFKNCCLCCAHQVKGLKVFINTIILLNNDKFNLRNLSVVVMGTKQPSLYGFLNQDKNMSKPSSKSKSQNEKNKNKNTSYAKQKSNKILLQEWNKNRIKLWQENVFKINVEQTENNVGFYLYLHPLGIWPKKPFQETSNLHVAHVHPCVTHLQPYVSHVHPC